MSDAPATSRGVKLTDQQRLDWLRLYRSENVGPATFRDLINFCGGAAAALEQLPDIAARGHGGKRIRIATEDSARDELDRLDEIGGRIVCLGEADYPDALRQCEGAPQILSVIGSTDTLQQKSVAFVGSRNASLSGIKLTQNLADEVGRSGYTIVSGLARGIDTAAHKASLGTGTVAVFAGGVDHIYPFENKELAKSILENDGSLISEMPLGWQPRAQDFPRRNRIVAGLALGTVVVEAARRSGSLITARLANEQGRLVFAVPGSPLDPRSEGTNHLIREGATLVTSASDIVSGVAPLVADKAQAPYSLDENERDEPQFSFNEPEHDARQRIVASLSRTPTDLDELIRFTQLPAATVHIVILELDLAGRLERHSGNKVSLI